MIARASASCAADGAIHMPGSGEPNPAQLSRVRSRCRRPRSDSGTETFTMNQVPSQSGRRSAKA